MPQGKRVFGGEKVNVHGRYVTGQGEASKYDSVYEQLMGYPMRGTFNVRCDFPLGGIGAWPPTQIFEHPNGNGLAEFRLVKLNRRWRAWAYRWPGTGQSPETLELVSKRLLPDGLKHSEIFVEFCERWDTDRVKVWCQKRYVQSWHQSFPWSPQRCDSALVWDAIDIIDWRGLSVLDYGCAWGYHTIRAAAAGAYAVGFDQDPESVAAAREVNDHIESQDATFTFDAPSGEWDVILYLSVHHQVDPKYIRLAETIRSLRRRARKALFVELILPPMFGSGKTAEEINRLVGGRTLLTYQHAVRGVRRIYEVEPGSTRAP